MHTNFTEEELQFEKEVNNFFKEKYPKDIKEKQDKSIPLVKEDFVRWQKTLYEKGWSAINWPKEYGGTGCRLFKNIFLQMKWLEQMPLLSFHLV